MFTRTSSQECIELNFYFFGEQFWGRPGLIHGCRADDDDDKDTVSAKYVQW
jgi:hypothetical protein